MNVRIIADIICKYYLTQGGGGSEGAGRVCVGGGVESELELGDGRKQQMVHKCDQR